MTTHGRFFLFSSCFSTSPIVISELFMYICHQQPAQRRPLYRPDLKDQNIDSNKTKPPPQRSPLQLRSFAWLNPSKDVFEKVYYSSLLTITN